MLLCAGISFSLAVIDPAAVHLLSWAGAAYIVWLAWKIATSQQRKTDFRQNQSVLGQLCFAVCERQNHFVRCYGTVDVCSAANTGAKLGSWRQRFAGDDWDVWQCVLGAGGASVSAIVSPVWSPVEYRACTVASLLRGTHFLLTKKSGRSRPLPLSNLLLKPYRLSVKVRAITSRCCSGVRELKRTA